MTLDAAQIERFDEEGFLFLENRFSAVEVDVIGREWASLATRNLPGRVVEHDGQTTRSLYAPDTVSEVMRRLSRHPRLVRPAEQILGGDVYIHQFKINVKAAFKGDMWQWHQDYIYWLREDCMAEPRALTAAVFLDDVTEFNGPMLFVPASHRQGVIDTPVRETAPDWHAHVGADLKYTLSPETLQSMVATRGIVSPKGRAGSVILFHCNVVHGSAANMSPFDRKMAFVTFNSVANRLRSVERPRPTFLANRDFTPVSPLADGALFESASAAARA